MRYCVLILLVGMAWQPADAQSEFLRPSYSLPDSNAAGIRFERNVNTYLWNAHASYLYNDNDLYIRLNDKFSSSLLFVRNQMSSYRDEQSLSVNASKKFSGPFAAAFDLQSFVLTDNQSIGSSNAGIHTGAFGVLYQPVNHVTITPMLGMRYDKQQLQRDQGMNYRFSAEAESLQFGDYRAEFSGRINQSDLGSRQFKNNAARLDFATTFSEGSGDSIQLRWLLNRNDFYIPADSNIASAFGTSFNIRSRSEQLWGVQNVLGYEIGSGFSTALSVNVESRSIQNTFKYKPLTVLSSIPFNTTVQEFRIDGGWAVNYIASSMMAMVEFTMGERNERHLLEKIEGIDDLFQENRRRQDARLDNIAFRNSVTASVTSDISSSDRMTFSGSVSLLQYDTPDTLNTDDRDELMMNISMRETHTFSDVFTASVLAEATLAHLVYLSRDKSANNNWNRIIRLQPELIYRPAENFRMVNAFEVSANYTVFDFELLVPAVKSYSYRQVAFLDSSSYDISRRVGFDIVAHVRMFERGEFHWQEFSERPQQRIEEITFSPQFRYTFSDRWYCAVGFRSFAQKKFTYVNDTRKFESTFLSAGPTTNIVIRLSPLSMVEIRGWKEFQRLSGGTIQEFSNMTMNVRYYF